VIGASGQVGGALTASLAQLGIVLSLDRTACDLARPDTLRAVVLEAAPDVVVNAAAYTAVDKAEDKEAIAERVNAVAPGVIAAASAEIGASAVHFSTDYVFDGRKAGSYIESDVPNPVSVYGRTKHDGERAVADANRRHLIFRTSWVFAERGSNFLRTILRLATERDKLSVVGDQVGAPTSAGLIATVTASVIAAMVDAGPDDPRWGTYHLAAAGVTNWHAYAKHIVAGASVRGLPLALKPETVVSIPTAAYPVKATRPANSRLDTTKLRSTFSIELPDWTEGVDETLNQLIVK
jgi:dTDP-4-dehydrorhamnose reductase